MNIAYYIQTLLTGMAILAIIVLDYLKQYGWKMRHQRLFMSMVGADFGLLALELALNLITGGPAGSGGPAGQVAIASTAPVLPLAAVVFLFYVLNPVPGALWLLYIRHFLGRTERVPKSLKLLIWLPVIFNAGLSVASLSGGYAFRILSPVRYERGPLFMLMAMNGYLYLLLSFISVLAWRSRIRRREFLAMLIFPLPILVGGILQTTVFGLSVVWLAFSISLLIVYIDMKHAEVTTDHLTGLANRRELDRRLETLMSGRRGNRLIGGIMIDLNDFKRINDVHGHDAGDRALEVVGRVLRSSIRDRDLAARYGGDEFMVILDLKQEQDLELVRTRIQDFLVSFNASRRLPFALSLSIGTGIFRNACEDDVEVSAAQATCDSAAFVRQLDERMYEDKRLYKESAAAWTKTDRGV